VLLSGRRERQALTIQPRNVGARQPIPKTQCRIGRLPFSGFRQLTVTLLHYDRLVDMALSFIFLNSLISKAFAPHSIFARDNVEFTIVGKNQPQKIRNIMLELKGINEKKNRSSLVYTVEDKRYEAKSLNLNSPLFFYLAGTHQPEEIVINKVGKNIVSGYLSIPKTNAQPVAATPKSGR